MWQLGCIQYLGFLNVKKKKKKKGIIYNAEYRRAPPPRFATDVQE